ncbi:RICIN domain-containing protein [Actinoplanes sp. NPDC049548]|uniref:right-handed parallel beta-helix repeat-containing protein n=1 Tax=Actinoplanes sp. NPDC049548 TaxID=3155152 RepID=UPI0034275300
MRWKLPLVVTAAAVLGVGAVVLALPSDAGTVGLPGPGTYTMRVERSDLCLTADGERLRQDTCEGQAFRLAKAGTATFTVIGVDGTCLTANGGSRVTMRDCASGHAEQQWRLSVARRHTVQLVNVSSGQCLSDEKASRTAGTTIIQESCTNNSNKRWNLAAVTGGSAPAAADIVVAPDGDDAGTGTLADPYRTIAKAVAAVRPGQTIALRGGTYRPAATIRITSSGSASQRITLQSYGDEKVTVDLGGLPAGQWGIDQTASYWTVRGLELKNGPSHAYVCTSCSHDVIARIDSHDNGDSGLALRGAGTTDNQILDSDLHGNHDDVTKGQNADGLAIKFGSGTGNLVRGVRLFHNADDGVDLWEFTSPVTIENSWAYGNGINRWRIAGFEGNGSGFKLGGGRPAPPVAHVVRASKAWDNAGNGFTENSNRGRLSLTHDTAFRNRASGYFFRDSAATLTGNLDLGNATRPAIGPHVTEHDNSWNTAELADNAAIGTDPATAQGPRQADGSLPVTRFLLDPAGRWGA